MYLIPDEVDIKEPPIIVNNIKNMDILGFEKCKPIPDVDSDEVVARKKLEMFTSGRIKKLKIKIIKTIIATK